jgi:hypothetical protein
MSYDPFAKPPPEVIFASVVTLLGLIAICVSIAWAIVKAFA